MWGRRRPAWQHHLPGLRRGKPQAAVTVAAGGQRALAGMVAGAVRAHQSVTASGGRAWYVHLTNCPAHILPAASPKGTSWLGTVPHPPSEISHLSFPKPGAGVQSKLSLTAPSLVPQEQFEFALTAVAEEVNAILQALPQ